MNPFFSVRFRLFALCVGLLVVLGGANLFLGQIIQEREPQELEQLAQYRRVETIYAAQQAINTYRYWRGQLNTAVFVKNSLLEAQAQETLLKAEEEVSRRLTEVETFDPASAGVIRTALTDLPKHMGKMIEAMALGEQSQADVHFGEAKRRLDSIVNTLKAANEREQSQAEEVQRHQQASAAAGIRMSAWIILLSTPTGLIITWVVLRSIIRPLRTTVLAIRQVNAGETFMDMPPVGRDEFGDMAVALRQFRDQAERLRHLAYSDTLTGLGNRASLDQALQAGIEACRRDGTRLALLYVDLDNFSNVNDSLGHGAGDRYLCEAALRLQRFMPLDASLCRYSGDKFTVLIEGLESSEGLHQRLQSVAEGILHGMAEPYPLGGQLLPMSVTIGIAVFPADGETGEQMLSSADAAMYAAKRFGRNSLRFARPELMADARAQLDIAADIQRGLENEEFEPFYQPVIDVSTGRVNSAEALLRWRHPRRGILLASEFIPAAESTGLIHALGERCLIRVAGQVQTWADQNCRVRVSVNLSARQIENRSVLTLLEKFHAANDARVDCLDFEITESAMLEQIEQARETLTRVKELGYRLSLDDFGTGYSSLAYLQRFPLDKIKIDRSFVARMDSSKEARAIIAATVALAGSLDLEVIAEGVETIEHQRQLEEMGCTLQQGFYFTAALPADEFQTWCAAYEGRAKNPL